MTTQINASFNELIYASVSEASRVSNNEHDFLNRFENTTAEPIKCESETANDIYNLGVYEGASSVLDSLHKAGYQIIDPEGVKVEPAEGSTFSADFFSRKYWEVVSS